MKLSVTKLENARFDPKSVAAELGKKSGFGNNGSFKGTFSNYIGRFHHEDIEIEKLHALLSDAFKLSFVANADNERRAVKYCDAFLAYTKFMDENGFGLDNNYTLINWKVLPDAFLGGRSPILCSNDTRNIAFSIEENTLPWYNQLKYPLFQMYLAERYYQCEVDKVEVGIFNIHTGQFELKIFEDVELDNAFEETKNVLKKVKYHYDNPLS
ncbi:hypothetical protein Pedsa_1280 [Pseudopedobacter saltans DSM 12145]|uniref:Uncharacterized protein n=1 Tax=Pseudopedobacter saltans (strain ATCC 51119 / DSM 12145 / JCM 21818 / CCUG 39354 / LMG 10337 / NBRC 100064 / NCIMB 13643) TaxID=762903 RepID=F0SDV1_PSESL|nr:hypothetical protein [Pseudopedobacter saltans]ADY51847.1 hypothetical protein Pedsa_1280 [Pseudopedobacter saltans DSM 12145]